MEKCDNVKLSQLRVIAALIISLLILSGPLTERALSGNDLPDSGPLVIGMPLSSAAKPLVAAVQERLAPPYYDIYLGPIDGIWTDEVAAAFYQLEEDYSLPHSAGLTALHIKLLWDIDVVEYGIVNPSYSQDSLIDLWRAIGIEF